MIFASTSTISGTLKTVILYVHDVEDILMDGLGITEVRIKGRRPCPKTQNGRMLKRRVLFESGISFKTVMRKNVVKPE